MKKMNTLALKSIGGYGEFVKCFHPKPDSKPDDPVSAPNCPRTVE